MSKTNYYHNLRELNASAGNRRGSVHVNSPRKLIVASLLLITLLSVASPYLQPVQADPVSELSVQVTANVLRAGSNNTITMHVAGIGKLLANLDISLTLPSPLVLFGDNHWRRSGFGPGDTIDATLMIFAPASAAGNSYQATVNGLYKEAGETTYSQESHTVGLLVRGWIDLVIYDLLVTPSPAGAGLSVEISGSLLNRGITSAMFTNLTIKPQPPLIVSSQSISYMGQVDANAPAPFSLTADIEPGTADGRYAVTLVVYYQDDLHMNQQVETSFFIDVSHTATQTQTTTRATGVVSSVLEYAQYLILLVIVVVVVLLVRRLRKRRSNNALQARRTSKPPT